MAIRWLVGPFVSSWYLYEQTGAVYSCVSLFLLLAPFLPPFCRRFLVYQQRQLSTIVDLERDVSSIGPSAVCALVDCAHRQQGRAMESASSEAGSGATIHVVPSDYVDSVVKNLSEASGRNIADVFTALTASNGHVQTAACVLSNWSHVQSSISDSAPEAPLGHSDLPMTCEETGKLIWTSAKVDDVLGATTEDASNAVNKLIFGFAAAGKGLPPPRARSLFRRNSSVKVQDVIDRITFLSHIDTRPAE